MKIDISDSRLSSGERRLLQEIAAKLPARTPPRQELPEGYRRAIEEAFGETDVDRWQPDLGRCQER